MGKKKTIQWLEKKMAEKDKGGERKERKKEWDVEVTLELRN